MVDPSGTPGTTSPLTDLLHDQVERILARCEAIDSGIPVPSGTLERFLGALATLEEAAAALTGDGCANLPPASRPEASPLEDARSYAHLAGLLPRALERAISFDAAACAIRRPDGELAIDSLSRGDPAVAEIVRQRVAHLHRVLAGGLDGPGSILPPRPQPLRSGLYVPLLAGGVVVGVTYLASLEEGAFTDADQRLLGELAAHATGAFQRIDGQLRGVRATPRQAQVLSLVAAGLSDKEIAARLAVSTRTVRTHLERILREHNFGSRTQAATAWLRGERGVVAFTDSAGAL